MRLVFRGRNYSQGENDLFFLSSELLLAFCVYPMCSVIVFTATFFVVVRFSGLSIFSYICELLGSLNFRFSSILCSPKKSRGGTSQSFQLTLVAIYGKPALQERPQTLSRLRFHLLDRRAATCENMAIQIILREKLVDSERCRKIPVCSNKSEGRPFSAKVAIPSFPPAATCDNMVYAKKFCRPHTERFMLQALPKRC
jgi:hypothetical protein